MVIAIPYNFISSHHNIILYTIIIADPAACDCAGACVAAA